MDRDFLKSMIGFEINDMNFKHHMDNVAKLNFAIVIVQLVSCYTGLLISALTDYNIARYTAVLNLGLLIVVLLNNKISDVAWRKAKRRQEMIIAMNDILDDKDLTSEDIHLHFSNIRGYKIKHSDDRFEHLVNMWYENIHTKKREKLKYKDANGINYHVGDIVFKPCLGDLWLVTKLSEEEMKKFGFTIPYVLTLYGNDDEYVMEIDEPEGFKIEYTPESELYAYIKGLVIFSKVYKVHKQEMEYIENKDKEDKEDGKQKIETERDDQ